VTLLEERTGQILTRGIRLALYNRLFQADPEPVGLAFETCYRQLGGVLSQYVMAVSGDAAAQQLPEALSYRLVASDLQSLVILGDPTAVLPSLAAVGADSPG
jgi:hypothetical protein